MKIFTTMLLKVLVLKGELSKIILSNISRQIHFFMSFYILETTKVYL